jgi:hypothetical protein
MRALTVQPGLADSIALEDVRWREALEQRPAGEP